MMIQMKIGMKIGMIIITNRTVNTILGMLSVMNEWGEGVITISNSSHKANQDLFKKVVSILGISNIGKIIYCNESICSF